MCSELIQKQPPEVFFRIDVLKLCQSLFFHKVAGLKPATLLKGRLWHMCFPVNFARFLRATLFFRTSLVAASAIQTSKIGALSKMSEWFLTEAATRVVL